METVEVVNNEETQYNQSIKNMRVNASKRSNGIDSVMFGVHKEPLYTKDGTPAGAWAIRRDDNQLPIGIVSDEYKIIQTRDIALEAEKSFMQKGLFNPTISMWNSRYGASNFIQYDFKHIAKEVTKGDMVGLRMTLKNSYDGVSKASFTLGMLRLVCTNGLTSVQNDVFLSARHTQSSIEGFNVVQAIETMMNNWEEDIGRLNQLSSIDVPQQLGHNILDNLVIENRLSERVAKYSHNVWASPYYSEDKPRTAWSLLNSITQSTRDLYETRKSHGDIAMRVTKNVSSAFSNIRNVDEYNRLTQTPVSSVIKN